MEFQPKILELNKQEDYCIISDIHGCLDELKELIEDGKGWWIDSKGNMREHRFIRIYRFILIGDYLDKGPQIADTISFLYQNREHFIFVKGNHENFVHKYLTGQRGSYNKNNNKELIEGWFHSVYLLQTRNDLKEKFFYLFENSYDFVFNDNFIVTHAPCKKEYLGRTDKQSVDKQRNLVYPKRIDFNTDEEHRIAKKECLQFLLDEADEKDMFHIFGHIMTKEIFLFKNKIGIDTGCVAGGSLSCVCFEADSNIPVFQQYQSRHKNVIENYFQNADA